MPARANYTGRGVRVEGRGANTRHLTPDTRHLAPDTRHLRPSNCGGRMPAGKPVGLIGVGLMGTACAGRLRGGGFDVLGYDVDPRKLDGLRLLGGRAAGSIAEVARECEQAVLAVFDTGQVEDAVEALLAARPNAAAFAVICVSTCDPD